MDELRHFLQSEIRRRDISIREFAKQSGVSKGTIGRLVNPVPPDEKEPGVSLETLFLLSKYTKTPLVLLLKMADPDVEVEVGEYSPYAQLLAKRIENSDEIAIGYVERILDESERRNQIGEG